MPYSRSQRLPSLRFTMRTYCRTPVEKERFDPSVRQVLRKSQSAALCDCLLHGISVFQASLPTQNVDVRQYMPHEKYLTPRKTLDLLTLASYYIKMRQNRYKRNWRPFPQKIFNFKKCNILHLFCFPRLICFCFLIRCFFLIRINFRHCDFRHFFRFTRTQLPGSIAAESNNAITLFFIFPPFSRQTAFYILIIFAPFPRFAAIWAQVFLYDTTSYKRSVI